jgi:hypothetical protein
LGSIAAVGLIALKAMKQSITVVDCMLFVLFENVYEIHAPPAPMKALGARVRFKLLHISGNFGARVRPGLFLLEI